jgi:dTDP-4-dehydrorhamnose 3,5-epimerase
MGFTFTPLDLQEVLLVEPDTYRDDRGFFRETFKASAFASGGVRVEFVQANVSRSSAGVLRGLHFQRPPAGVAKLVSVAQGRIFDVAADVRQDSPTLGRWVGAELSAAEGRSLFVPEGFAHGFLALQDDTVVTYLMTGEFSSEHDTGVRWDDPDLGIDWPVAAPILSEKDLALPTLSQIHAGTRIDRTAEEATL